MAGINQSPAAMSVQKKQKYLLIGLAGVIVLVAVVAAILGTPAKREQSQKPEVPVKKNFGQQETSVTEKDIWRTQEGARVTQLQEEIKALQDKMRAEESDRRRTDEKTAAGQAALGQKVQDLALNPPAIAAANPPGPAQPVAPQKPLPPLPQQPRSIDPATGMPSGVQIGMTPPGGMIAPGGAPVNPLRGLVKIQVSSGGSSGGAASDTSGGGDSTKGKEEKTSENYLPSGTFLKAINLAGLDAPTGGQVQQNPHPILFRITDFANLPNRFKADYKECYVTGNGYGDLSSERAYIRLDRMSCVAEDGATIDLSIKGYVAGEDGKAGMRGRLVSKQGAVLANALVAGIASGIGQAFVQSNTSITNSPYGTTTQQVEPGKAFQTGAAQGVGKALDRLANYYVQLAEKMFPIIEIDSGREVDIVITRGMSIDR